MSFLADVFVHTGFFMGFLPLFFFLYVSPTQSRSLTNDFFNILTPYLDVISRTIGDQISYEQLDSGLQKLEESIGEQMSSFTASVQEKNDKIKKLVAIVVGITAPLLIILGCIIEVYYGGNLVKFLISNLIVIGFIAASEFAIVAVFMSNFIEIDGRVIVGIFEDKTDNPWGGCWYSNKFIRSLLPQWLANKILQHTPPS